MSKTIPSYLRIHRDSRPSDLASPVPHAPGAVEGFWQAYSEATGWRVDRRHAGDEALEVQPAVLDGVATIEDAESLPAVTREAAKSLAQAATRMAAELQRQQEALRVQEMELAARATAIVGTTQSDLADRIEETLADAALACRCDSAAMYLLDDDTQILSLRAMHNLPEDRRGVPPRELREARGDLEAMVQGVISIDDLQNNLPQTWACPEADSGAAICAVILQDDLPIGTLWLFASQPTEFRAPEVSAARLAASTLASALSSAAAAPSPELSTNRTAVREIAEWQHASLPAGTQLDQDWSVDGMIESPQSHAVGWHAWDVLPDGMLSLAIAEAHDPGVTGAMIATVARSALIAHSNYRHSAGELMRRVSDTLWQTSAGDQLISMLYLHLDPESGEGTLASSGSITAMVASRYGYRPLVHADEEPLGSHIEGRSQQHEFWLCPGEVLLAHGPGLFCDDVSQWTIGEALTRAMKSNRPNPLAELRRAMAQVPLRVERGAAAMMRRENASG